VVYIQLSALFVGAMLVIVYAGAIMVLFLFVIMLLNLRGTEDFGAHSSALSKATKYLVSVLLFVEFVFIIKSVIIGAPVAGLLSTTPPVDDFGSVKSVSMLLFTKYLYPFELTGVLLLIAVVGAVVIARRDRAEDAEEEASTPGTDPEKTDEVVTK
jgi:NADH-quinone oxidoreductase subunit J